jgi:hypothetical protein
MTRPQKDQVLSTPDAVSLGVFMLAGAALAVWSVVAAVLRIAEVAPGTNVPVLAVFEGTAAQAPIGPDGAMASMTLDQAWITAPELPVAAVWALVIQQIIQAVTIITVVVCLLLLVYSILRGTVFSRRNTGLVTTAGLTALIGFALVPFFGNMGANGAFAMISERTFNNVILSVDLMPFIVVAFVAALGGTVFTVGARMQRETEGLV